MKLYIKHMVSVRCKMAVKAELDKLGLHYGIVELGEVEIRENLTSEQHDQLKNALSESGLELMEDKKNILIEKIKSVIIEMTHAAAETIKIKKSAYISAKLNHDYNYIASKFNEATGTTIKEFFIAQKIERVQELLLHEELNLTQISYKLNYSSVAHLSHQFKMVTGLTPTYFKQLNQKGTPTRSSI
jgi:AraC-like DNA-binding protein